MLKDFNGRNKEKQKLDSATRVAHPKPREIWYIKIGINIGREIYGKEGFFRPVLVVSKIGNLYFCMPLTTKPSNSSYTIPMIYNFSDHISYVKKEQGRVYDMQRFFTRCGILPHEEFTHIKNLLRDMYFPRDLI